MYVQDQGNPLEANLVAAYTSVLGNLGDAEVHVFCCLQQAAHTKSAASCIVVCVSDAYATDCANCWDCTPSHTCAVSHKNIVKRAS